MLITSRWKANSSMLYITKIINKYCCKSSKDNSSISSSGISSIGSNGIVVSISPYSVVFVVKYS